MRRTVGPVEVEVEELRWDVGAVEVEVEVFPMA
jgi:hypothetical protein